MRTKFGLTILWIGAIYIAIGFFIIIGEGNISATNINATLIPSVLFAAIIYSAVLALSELYKQLYVKFCIIKALQEIVIAKTDNEIDIYKKIEIAMKMKNKAVNNIIIFFSAFALPLSIVCIFIKYAPDNFVLTGLSIFTFGLIITNEAMKDDSTAWLQLHEKEIWLNFYKRKNEIGK